MSIALQTPKKTVRETAKPLKVHYVPANIAANGNTSVEKYFETFTAEESGGLINALRGRPLKGCIMDVPKGKIGVVFRETWKPMHQTDRILTYVGQFTKFTYWNYDVNPSDNDAINKSFYTLHIIEAAHQQFTNNKH